MTGEGKKPTMSDVAARVGVSQATVSLVINNAPGTRISVLTRERVLAVARELGYEKLPQPHRPGRVIGLLINELTTSQHAAGFLETVRDEAAAHDCLVAAFATGGVPEIEAEALDYLAARPLVGVIYTALLTQAVNPPERLSDVPAVLLNCHAAGNRFPSVVPGDVSGGFAATCALLDAGHRRVAMINGEDWIEAARDRLQGYRQALTTHDIPIDPTLIVSGGWTLKSGREQANRLLDLADPPTAIFCYCDRMAVGAYEAIQARGLRIPDDVSVVGFDNESYFAADMLPALTTVTLPHEDMARWAVSQLLDQAGAKPEPAKHRKLKMECRLVARQSVGPVSEVAAAGKNKRSGSMR